MQLSLIFYLLQRVLEVFFFYLSSALFHIHYDGRCGCCKIEKCYLLYEYLALNSVFMNTHLSLLLKIYFYYFNCICKCVHVHACMCVCVSVYWCQLHLEEGIGIAWSWLYVAQQGQELNLSSICSLSHLSRFYAYIYFALNFILKISYLF